MSLINHVPQSTADPSAAGLSQFAHIYTQEMTPHISSFASNTTCIYPSINVPNEPEFQIESSLYRKKSHEKLRHCAFSPDEDANLRNLISIHGETNWQKIALSMFRRSARQCRERWMVLKKREESKRPWTEEDDALLVQKCIELGPKWKKIELYFNGRDSQSLKCRWKLLTRNAEIDSLMMSEQVQSTASSGNHQTNLNQETNSLMYSQSNSNSEYSSSNIIPNLQVNSFQNKIHEPQHMSPSEAKGPENFDFAFWDFMNYNNDDNAEDLFSFCW